MGVEVSGERAGQPPLRLVHGDDSRDGADTPLHDEPIAEVRGIAVGPVGLNPNTGKQNYYQPYPDPGETYDHVNTQLFNVTSPPYNLPPVPPPLPPATMNGFVTDYIENYKDVVQSGILERGHILGTRGQWAVGRLDRR